MPRQTIRPPAHDLTPASAKRLIASALAQAANAALGTITGTAGRLAVSLGRGLAPTPAPVPVPVRAGARRRGRRLARFAGDRQGAAAIEVAAVMPILVLVGLGTFEFGHIFYSTQLIQTGLRDAARYIARAPNPTAAESTARQLATTGTADGSGAPRVSWWQTNEIQITYETTANLPDATTGLRAYRAGDQLQVVRVSTAIDYQGLGFLNSTIGPIRIAAAHEERYVGQ